jgi:hypothetical protein
LLPCWVFACALYKQAAQDDAIVIDAGPRRDARAATDASEPDTGSARCDLSKPFGPLVRAPAPVNTDWYSSNVALTSDALSMFMAIQPGRTGVVRLALATRGSAAAMWGIPTPLSPMLNLAAENADPALSADGLTLYYSAGPSFFERQMYVASRTNPRTEFASVTKLDKLASLGHNGRPTLRRDGEEFCFQSTRAGTFDLLCAPIRAGLVGDPVFQSELNTDALEACPVLGADGLSMYFSSTRSPSLDQDIWRTTRPSPTGKWTKPVAVTELNSPQSEQPIWLSEDNCTLYVNSTRDGRDALWLTTP